MAVTIITKNGSGVPLASDLVKGELAVDLTNRKLYTKDDSGQVVELTTYSGSGGGTSGPVDWADILNKPQQVKNLAGENASNSSLVSGGSF